MTSLLASMAMSQATRRPGGSKEERLAATGAAVNLRDIADAAPGKLRKGMIYRCSQIYSREVLQELHIHTIVDLRGRAPTRTPSSSHHRHRHPSGAPEVDQPEVSGNGRRQQDAAATAYTGHAPGETGPDHQMPAALLDPDTAEKLQQAGQEVEVKEQAEGADMVAFTRSSSRSKFPAVAEEGSLSSSDSETDLKQAADQQQPAAPTVGLPGPGPQEPIRQSFSLIPGKEFGLRLLRFPPRVWLAAVGNLVTGKDARKPFVDAFADEQILGFTKYYIMMLEHSKRNIADVLRIFVAPDALPALVHCAHGKDRTGVVVMLLMLLCGLEPEEVTADYEQSEVELKQYRERLGLQATTMAVIPLDDVIVASTRETIRAVMEYLLHRYLTVEDYLLTTGLTQQELAAIRCNLQQQQQQPASVTAAAGGNDVGVASSVAVPAGRQGSGVRQ